jgi:hypothetical protein
LGLEAPGFGFTFLKPKPSRPGGLGLAWLGLKPQLASNFPQVAFLPDIWSEIVPVSCLTQSIPDPIFILGPCLCNAL